MLCCTLCARARRDLFAIVARCDKSPFDRVQSKQGCVRRGRNPPSFHREEPLFFSRSPVSFLAA